MHRSSKQNSWLKRQHCYHQLALEGIILSGHKNKGLSHGCTTWPVTSPQIHEMGWRWHLPSLPLKSGCTRVGCIHTPCFILREFSHQRLTGRCSARLPHKKVKHQGCWLPSSGFASCWKWGQDESVFPIKRTLCYFPKSWGLFSWSNWLSSLVEVTSPLTPVIPFGWRKYSVTQMLAVSINDTQGISSGSHRSRQKSMFLWLLTHETQLAKDSFLTT